MLHAPHPMHQRWPIMTSNPPHLQPLLLLLDGRHGSEAISKQLAPIIMPGLQTNDGLQG